MDFSQLDSTDRQTQQFFQAKVNLGILDYIPNASSEDSDHCANAQTDLNLRWAHMAVCFLALRPILIGITKTRLFKYTEHFNHKIMKIFR